MQKIMFFCKLVPDSLHSKVIWWRGHGAYIGSANLTDRAWNSNIEAGVYFSESDLADSGMIEQLTEFFENLQSLEVCFDLTESIINEHWFKDLNQAWEIIRDWRQHYNERRPHSTLNYLTPLEFAANYRSGKKDTISNDVTS